MTQPFDIATSRPIVQDDHAQVLKLAPPVAHIALELGLGRAHPTRRGFLFSRDEERRAIEEIGRRREERREKRPTGPVPAVVYESPDLLRALREVEIGLIELQLKVRSLTAVVLVEMSS